MLSAIIPLRLLIFEAAVSGSKVRGLTGGGNGSETLIVSSSEVDSGSTNGGFGGTGNANGTSAVAAKSAGTGTCGPRGASRGEALTIRCSHVTSIRAGADESCI